MGSLLLVAVDHILKCDRLHFFFCFGMWGRHGNHFCFNPPSSSGSACRIRPPCTSAAWSAPDNVKAGTGNLRHLLQGQRRKSSDSGMRRKYYDSHSMGRCNRCPADMQTLPDRTGRSVDRGGHNHDCVQEGEKEEQETDNPEILCIKYVYRRDRRGRHH